MANISTRLVSRRGALEAIGVGSLGLASAALLGCGSTSAPAGGGGVPTSGKEGGVAGATSGGGLPL